MMRPEPIHAVASAYAKAKSTIIAAGFAEEIVWQEAASSAPLTEKRFLQETAWVILSSGMREAVIRRKFPEISRCFFRWDSARKIGESAEACFHSALRCFNHPAKIRAIIEVARRISAKGFDQFEAEVKADPIQAVKQFPFIGPITCYHLAKNIGAQVAKPDRHLRRIAEVCGYENVQVFCKEIAEFVGDPVPVVDIVLWRYATLSPKYTSLFRGGQ
jgi:3-methyladenine DNA glycosylase Tag